MRLLLLRSALVMAVAAGLVLLACVLVSCIRTRRRARIERLVEDGRGRRPRSAWMRRAVLLEYADRLTGPTLRSTVPWSRQVLGAAVRDLGRRSWVRRARGLRTLAPLGISDFRLRTLLQDRDPRVRALAAGVATGRSDPAVLRALVGLLDGPAPYVRHAALDALTRRATGSSRPLIEALLATEVLGASDLDEVERRSAHADLAARSLSQDGMAPEPHRAGEASRTVEVEPGVLAVVVGLRTHGVTPPGLPDTLPRPLRATTAASTRTRTLLLMLRAAAASADPSLVPSAGRFLADARPEVRAAAVRTLAVLGAPAADLLDHLDDPDGRVRADACSAMATLRARDQAGRLASALADRDHGVRQAAAHALGRLGAAGRLLLERAAKGADLYAADAARAVLGRPPEPAR